MNSSLAQLHTLRSRRLRSLAVAAGCGVLSGFAAGAHADSPPAFASDPATSRLEFAGTQAGAEFKGQFKKFNCSVAFAPDDTASSHIEVQIELNSLDSQDADRDKTMRSADFFDIAHTPTATYSTRTIVTVANGYSAIGTLTLRGVAKPVTINFKFSSSASGVTLTGDALVKRLDFGVGQGEWKSTEWVGNDVKVHFSLGLKSKP